MRPQNAKDMPMRNFMRVPIGVVCLDILKPATIFFYAKAKSKSIQDISIPFRRQAAK
jgi:hypothetical protein